MCGDLLCLKTQADGELESRIIYGEMQRIEDEVVGMLQLMSGEQPGTNTKRKAVEARLTAEHPKRTDEFGN